MINNRFKNGVRRVKTYPGADNNPVVKKIKLKKVHTNKKQDHLNLDMLKEESIRSKFNAAVQNKVDVFNVDRQEQAPDSNDTVQRKWDNAKKLCRELRKRFSRENA